MANPVTTAVPAQPVPGTAVATPQNVVVHEVVPKRASFRSGFLSLWNIIAGTLLIIAGGLFIRSQRRYFAPIGTGPDGPTPLPGAIYSDSDLNAFKILAIIAFAMWLIYAILNFFRALAVSRRSRLLNASRRFGRTLILSKLLLIIGTICCIIGFALLWDEDLGGFTTAGILLLIGAFFITYSTLLQFAADFAVAVQSMLLPTYRHRKTAWGRVQSDLTMLIADILFCLSFIFIIVNAPPGVLKIASLLFLVASIFAFFSWSNDWWNSLTVQGDEYELAALAAGHNHPLLVPVIKTTAAGVVPLVPIAAAAGAAGAAGATAAGTGPTSANAMPLPDAPSPTAVPAAVGSPVAPVAVSPANGPPASPKHVDINMGSSM